MQTVRGAWCRDTCSFSHRSRLSSSSWKARNNGVSRDLVVFPGGSVALPEHLSGDEKREAVGSCLARYSFPPTFFRISATLSALLLLVGRQRSVAAFRA